MSTGRAMYRFGFVAVSVLMLILGLALPAQGQTVLIDFGNASSYRGQSVTNPDMKGHYWNSVWSGAYYPGLLSTNGTATAWAFGFDVPGPTDSYNGPAGDTSVPGGNLTGCVFNATALGDFAITNAVYDFYVNSSFQIQGLTPGTTYTLKFYSSHKYSDSDYTVFSIYTNSAYTLLSNSGTLKNQTAGDPAAHNQDTTLTLTSQPWTNGILYVKFLGTNSGSVVGSGTGGYLNCLQITSGGGGGGGGNSNLPPRASTILVDFGNNLSYRGTNVPRPDIHGNYWNSVWSGAFYGILTNAAGSATALALGFDSATGTDSYNGPAGTSTNPNDCVINTNALGYLGINEAAFDFYVTSTFQIQGMDPAKQYSLTFFGSHKYNTDNVTKYSVCQAGYSTIITSVTLTVGIDNAHNQDQVAVISGVSPQTNGIMYVKFEGQTTASSGYLNCMQIVDLSGTNAPPPAVDPTKEVLLDFGNNQSYRGTNVPRPDVKGHYWNSLYSGAFVGVITNAAGQPTSMALGFDSATGTDSYNGPAGTSTNPADCLYNATALGDLGINEAVFDFYVSSGFQIQGVDPTHSYKLTFFGSHKYNTDNTTVYAVCDSSYNPLVTTSLVVGVDNNHNQDKVATLNNVTAPSGTMYIKFYGQSLPLSGYLNCMSLVDLTTNVAPPGANPTNTCLLDFGMNGTYRGTNTPLTGLTDSLGHYWNNIGTNPLTALPLTNVLGQAAGYSFVFSSTNNTGFGTDSFNGPAGPTDGLPNNQGNNLGLCVFNPTALGWLGMTNAVYDFWVNGLMQIQGMNPAHSYKLTFFGSHKYNIDNTTLYQICSDATYTTVLLQTNLLVGNGASHNQGNVATLTSSPQPNGTMYIKFIGSAGNLGYLNCMQIEDLTGGGPPPTDAYATWRSYYFPGGGQNALGTSDPDGDGVINTNEFLAGFNPNDPNAYPHIIEIRRSAASGNNIKVTFLGANGDVSYSGGPQCRTNVLEYSTGILPSGSYSNNFVSTGQQVILCGGIGGGFVTNLVEVGGATNQPTRYYRIRVLAP